MSAKAKGKVASAPLTYAQTKWLAALLLCAQVPLWGEVLTWVAFAGTGLVVVRLLPALQTGGGRWRRWALPVLALVAALGIRAQLGYFLARDPCVQFLYILVGIKFVESRNTRDGTLLICLALFLAVTPFFYSQSIVAGLIALPTLFALGGSLAALRAQSGPRGAWWTQLAAPGRLMLQGIPLALFLFVLFPRLAGPLWGSPADAGARTGLSDRMRPGAISELSQSDAVAFRVDFYGRPPEARDRYWRGPVFARFNGREWTASFRLQAGRFAQREGPPIDYTVTLEPHGKLWLFALEHPVGLPRPTTDDSLVMGVANDIAFLTHDQQLLARTTVTQTVRYRQRSALRGNVLPVAGDATDNLQLPRNNARTAAFARELRASVDSDQAYIAAVLKRFRDEPYVYTLSPPLLEDDPDPVDAFLFSTRRGFCEHYAGAFVVLLRAAGIPARVVTGYQGGEMAPDGEYMIVRQSDAHAWSEAIVDGRWQRFDPTAAVAPSRVERGLGAALPTDDAVPYLARLEMTWLKGLRLQWDAINYQWQRGIVGFNIERQRDFLREFGLDNPRPVQLVMVIAFAAFAWVLAVLGFSRIRRTQSAPEVALWSRACRRLARAGLARRPDEGPLDYAKRAAARWPRWSTLLHGIGGSYAQLRYGPRSEHRAALLAQLRASVDALPRARTLGAAKR
jgi:transglutaminase-like putative cysteine protease